MPIRYRVDESLSLVFFMVDGNHTVSDLVRHHYETRTQVHYHQGLRLIYDVTRAEIEFSLEDLYTNNNLNEQEYAQQGYLLPVAIISNSSVLTLVSKTINLFSASLPLKLGAFTTLADAVTWLRLADEFPRIERIQQILAAPNDGN